MHLPDIRFQRMVVRTLDIRWFHFTTDWQPSSTAYEVNFICVYIRGNGGLAPFVCILESKWTPDISSTFRQLHTRSNITVIQWIKGWANPRLNLNHLENRKNSLSLPGIEGRFVGCPYRSWVITSNKVPQSQCHIILPHIETNVGKQ